MVHPFLWEVMHCIGTSLEAAAVDGTASLLDIPPGIEARFQTALERVRVLHSDAGASSTLESIGGTSMDALLAWRRKGSEAEGVRG